MLLTKMGKGSSYQKHTCFKIITNGLFLDVRSTYSFSSKRKKCVLMFSMSLELQIDREQSSL